MDYYCSNCGKKVKVYPFISRGKELCEKCYLKDIIFRWQQKFLDEEEKFKMANNRVDQCEKEIKFNKERLKQLEEQEAKNGTENSNG